MTSRKLHEAWGNFLGKCVLDCIYCPFPKITYILTFPATCLEQFLWGSVSWAAVLILPPNKIYLITLTLCIFFKSTFVSSVQLSSVAQSCPNSLQSHRLQHARPPCPSLTPGLDSNSCPLSRWCDPTISSSVVPFSFCPQSFPASGSFPMSQLFPSGTMGSIRASVLVSVLLMNIQGWCPLGFTGLISLLSKGLSRVFSGTTL